MFLSAYLNIQMKSDAVAAHLARGIAGFEKCTFMFGAAPNTPFATGRALCGRKISESTILLRRLSVRSHRSGASNVQSLLAKLFLCRPPFVLTFNRPIVRRVSMFVVRAESR